MLNPSTFGGVRCGFESDTLTWVSSLSNKYPWGSNPATHHTLWSIIKIHQNIEHFSNMVNTRQKHVKCFICKKTLCNENPQEAQYQQYHPISMNEGLLPNGILPPASWDHLEPSWFDYSRCTWMAIHKLSINDLLIDNVPGAPPPEDTPNEESIDPQQPDLTCTPDPTQIRSHRQGVGVENAGGKAYCKATGLYNNHRMYSEQWNPWHPFQSTHDLLLAQSLSQQMKTGIVQHLWRGLDNFKFKSFQSADALWKILSGLEFWLGDDSWIEADSHLIGTLYYKDIFQYIQFLLAHLPFQAHNDFEPVRLADSESCWINSETNMGDWRCDTDYQLCTGATIVPVICASVKSHWTNVLATSMHGHCISRSVLFEKISATHLKSTSGFLAGWAHVPRKVSKTLMKNGTPRLELCCLKWGILTSVALAWNAIVQMDSSDTVTLFWLPGAGIIPNKSWLLKSHLAHACCVKLLKVPRWGIHCFDHLITQATTLFTWSCWRTILLMRFTL